MRDETHESETDAAHETDSNDTSGSPLFNRRRVLSAAGMAGVTFAGIGAFAGTAAAWERLEVNFRNCSEAWIIVDVEDLDYEKYGRLEPLSVTAVVETAEGDAECRTIEVTRESATTVSEYGNTPVIPFSATEDENVLAVISYNHNDIAHCYFENENGCAQEPDVADWRDAECAEDLLERNPNRFNVPCAERWAEDAETDDTGPDDTGPDDTGSGDTGPDDTETDDTETDDAGGDDTGSGDTGTDDTGSGDTGTDDTGPGDTGTDDTGPDGTEIDNTGTDTGGLSPTASE